MQMRDGRIGKHCQTSLAEKGQNGFSFCLLEVLPCWFIGRGAPTEAAPEEAIVIDNARDYRTLGVQSTYTKDNTVSGIHTFI